MAANFMLVNRQPSQVFVRLSNIRDVVFDNAERNITFNVLVPGLGAQTVTYVEDFNAAEDAAYKARVAAIKTALNAP